MAKFNYRIFYGGETADGKYTESMMEFESEDEVKNQEDLTDVMRTIGLSNGYVKVGLNKIELALPEPEVDSDLA